MKIYIAGKITGDTDYREKFEKVEKILAERGFSVMNPARLGNYPGFSWEEYMGVSAAMQRVCDAVVLLPDWKDSKGARLEQKTAESLGQKIYVWPGNGAAFLIPFAGEDAPFGMCGDCGKEFNSELFNENEIKHCPWCGKRI